MDRPASAAATLGGVGVGASSLALQGGEPICGWGAWPDQRLGRRRPGRRGDRRHPMRLGEGGLLPGLCRAATTRSMTVIEARRAASVAPTAVLLPRAPATSHWPWATSTLILDPIYGTWVTSTSSCRGISNPRRPLDPCRVATAPSCTRAGPERWWRRPPRRPRPRRRSGRGQSSRRRRPWRERTLQQQGWHGHWCMRAEQWRPQHGQCRDWRGRW
jgi:hypothetical protein